MKAPERPEPPRGAEFEVTTTRHFAAWLAGQRASLAFTTYQAGKLFLLGLTSEGRLSVFERTFPRCMGLCVTPDARSLYLSALCQVWRFERATVPGEAHQDYDCLYIPQASYVTGDVDIHDMALDVENHIIFVNTLFSCLAVVTEQYSFIPIWRPPFISRLAAEDRCHLNGLAMMDRRPKYVSSISRADVNGGWRDQRKHGGVVVDVESGETIAGGLSMPHSPRLYRGRLWILNSGTGEFGFIDERTGRFEAVTFCPGYLRGLAFTDRYAVAGLSRPREDRAFSGLALEAGLERRCAQARCGLQVVDLESGEVVHGVTIHGVVSELYDIAVLPGVSRPMALGFKTDEINRVLSIGPFRHSA